MQSQQTNPSNPQQQNTPQAEGKYTDKMFESLDQKLNKMALEKRLQIEAEHLKRIKTNKIIRLYSVTDGNDLKVFTRILNNYQPELQVDSMGLWELIQRVVIVGKCGIHEWIKGNETDSFLVPDAFKNDHELTMYIKFTNPMGLWKLNEKLQNLFHIQTETKPNVVKEFYKYVSARKLLNHSTCMVICDDKLRDVFGLEYFDFNHISDMISGMFLPLDPCKITLTKGGDVKDNEEAEVFSNLQMFDIEVECDDVTQMPILWSNEIKMLNKKIEGNKIIASRLKNSNRILQEFIDNPIQMMSKYLILEKDIMGIKTKYFEDLNIQSALFELLFNKSE